MRFLNYSLKMICVLAMVFSSVAAATIEEAIVSKMYEQFSLDTNTYQIDVMTCKLKSADIKPGELHLRPMAEKEPLGLFSVYAEVVRNSHVIESGQVRFKIRKFADVLVTSDRVKRHDMFSVNNVDVRRMEITMLRDRPLTIMDDVANDRARRNLKRGSILTSASIEPIPDVESGNEVQIVYIDGLFRVATPGIVLRAAMAGEYVKVKNKESGKIVLARVVDSHAVAIDP